MSVIKQQAAALAERLLDDLKVGRRQSVGLADIELEARNIAPRDRRFDYYRELVDWSVKFLVEKAAR